MRMSTFIISMIIVLEFYSLIGVESLNNLKENYYKDTCPDVEEIVRTMTWDIVAKKPPLIPRLLRMQFHDCFVRGCDGSILLDSKHRKAEKNATQNQSLLGGTYEAIDKIKAKLEEVCPGVVSCADILAMATRDSVSYQFKMPIWEVETGRKDGRVSRASEVGANIPPPSSNFTSLKQSFSSKNLNVHDLTVLSGAHTIGVGHCNLFSYRLYNFTGKGDADPTLDPSYAAFLKTKCRNVSDNVTTVPTDPGSSLSFDTNYYSVVKSRRGLFESDSALLNNGEAKWLVDKLQNPDYFYEEFGKSMKKMCAIGVITGNQGEIRKKCNVVNK